MHIPDGYLAPAFSLGMGVVTVPSWAIAARRVRKQLNQRTVPLLAIFAAMCFTIMMFNVPVPGGTTAHGVGGTLVAIVLGPSAAVIVVSTALIIQALFFGDGGVLSIFANCFNMGVVLPIVGYLTYLLVAGKSPLLSSRRVWAAGIGAYVGISVAALFVGIELGLQPLLFNDNGTPLYSPYGLQVAVPAMLAAHMFGASLVEAIITGLGVAYLQQHHPEFLTSLRFASGGDTTIAVGQTKSRPTWQLVGGGIVLVAIVLLVAGFITGGGDLSNAFGADWSSVDWSGVGTMLSIVAVLGVILIPLAWFGLPRKIRTIGTAYVAIAIITPIGLIAPGFAYGEGGPDDLQKELGYVPQGLQDLSGFFSAPFKEYNMPLPFFNADDAPMWHTAIGYELAGLIGMLVLGLILWGIGTLIMRRDVESDLATPSGAVPG
ncbi:MAG: cobalt transporter CbiM [Chloroflexi bacterium]|nr:cobalt transporter CbiM [Chloroflexota bacterium]